MNIKYVVLLILFSISISFAKNKDDIIEEFVFPENISVSDSRQDIIGIYNSELSQSEIYLKTLEWLADLIVDSKSAIEHKDEENYKIIGRSKITIIESTYHTSIFGKRKYMYFDRDLKFNFKIEIKEGRYRMALTNLNVTYPNGRVLHLNESAYEKQRHKQHIKKLWNEEIAPKLFITFESLNTFLKNETDEDW